MQVIGIWFYDENESAMVSGLLHRITNAYTGQSPPDQLTASVCVCLPTCLPACLLAYLSQHAHHCNAYHQPHSTAIVSSVWSLRLKLAAFLHNKSSFS